MSNRKIELNRRRALAGLCGIGVASVGAGAGTMALFSDSEQSTANQVTAGTLDLDIDGADTATTTVEATNIAPGYTGSDSSTVANAGSIDGFLDVEVGSVSGTTEMKEQLQIRVLLDDDGDTTTTGDQSVVVNDYATSIAADRNTNHELMTGESSNLVVEWTLDGDADNDVQGDSVSFDITVKLDQKMSQ